MVFQIRNNTHKKDKGFTLIETMVAVTILVTAIVGPLVIAYQGVSMGVDSRDRLIASYLAQDAIEYVRYYMVTNSNGNATTTDVMVGLENCDTNDGGKVCRIDTKSDLIAPCVGAGNTCAYLSWNTANGYYGYGGGAGWETSPFNREIRVYWDNTGTDGIGSLGPLDGGTEYLVEVKVYWGKNKEKDLTVTADFTDWRSIFN